MSIWSDVMANLIDSIKSDPIVYYVGLLFGIGLLCFIIVLIVKNDKKKKQKVQETIEERARIERHVDLEAMIAQMQEQEQSKLKDVDPVANFEQEQEEKAIISYQELVSAVKSENKEPISVTNVSSTGDIISTTQVSRTEIREDKPIFIDEIKVSKKELEFDIEQLEEENNTLVVCDTLDTEEIPAVVKTLEQSSPIPEPVTVEVSNVSEKKEQGKFKNTEFISPIYGRQNSNITYPKIATFQSKEETNDQIIQIGDDVDPNVEFLKTLREYRNNE